jgi:predicted Zn-dependent peptidase
MIPMTKNNLTLAALLGLAAMVSSCSTAPTIVARPEKLQFPELSFQPPHARQYRVPLKSGPVAYVVPDRELPLVNISILVRCGEYLDPAGKEGLAGLTGALLYQGGTEKLTANELEERAAFLAAQFQTAVEGTAGNVSLNLLSKDLDEGLGLLRDILVTPRFQADKLQLRKDQTAQAMKQRNDDSAGIEGREAGNLAYGEKFWANRDVTSNSLAAITRDDLVAFHRRWFHPANFVVAVSGDFDRDAMIARLEKLFADWPFRGETPPPVPADAAFAAPGVYLVNKDVNQGRVSLMLPGILRDDPDLFAAGIMNDILGGGGFTSRIVNRVRTEEGLAYSAGSSLSGGTYFPTPFTASCQTQSRKVAYAVSLILAELKRMAAEPVTDEEIRTSIKSKIESFPRAFASKAQTAGLFAQEEFTGRFATNPDFYQNYRDKIRAVTKADIQRVARRLLHPDRVALLIVGQRDEILQGHPGHAARLHDFAGGNVIELPLRDPQTLEPQGRPRPVTK